MAVTDKTKDEYKKRYINGQFFTSMSLVKKMIELFNIDFTNKTILEPSCGDCVFIDSIEKLNCDAKVIGIDIDKKLCKKHKNSFKNTEIICGDFLKYKFHERFDIVIGNPPFNLSTDVGYINTTEGFLDKGLSLLKPNGDLYMVLPATILRNKLYQKIREKIIKKFSIIGILNTSKYDFLGADVETIIIHIKNKEPKTNQEYFYFSDDYLKNVVLDINSRYTIKVTDSKYLNTLNEKMSERTLGSLFNIYRGRSKSNKQIKGRTINFYSSYLKGNGSEQFIGIQNIAYRFTSNVIEGNIDEVADTVTILMPKIPMTFKQLLFYSEYLNTSIAHYKVHVSSLNFCKLTIHMDKYYIDDLRLPHETDIEKVISNCIESMGTKEIALNRNKIFYSLLNLDFDTVQEIESKWVFPRFLTKHIYEIKEN